MAAASIRFSTSSGWETMARWPLAISTVVALGPGASYIDSQGFAWLPGDDFIDHFAGDIDRSTANVMFAVQQALHTSTLEDLMGVPAWRRCRRGSLSPRATRRFRPTPSGASPSAWDAFRPVIIGYDARHRCRRWVVRTNPGTFRSVRPALAPEALTERKASRMSTPATAAQIPEPSSASRLEIDGLTIR